MIGYYIHHQGRGHLNRALAIAAELDQPVVGLSSQPRPLGWIGEWIELPRDDEAAEPRDVDAEGRLHWVPLHDSGLRARMARISQWISESSPRLIVVDVSVEVALLARLLGVPVVSVALPGIRADEAHRLGFDISTAIIAAWPQEADGMISGLSAPARRHLSCVGAISRFGSRGGEDRLESGAGAPRRVLLLGGAGGSSLDASMIAAARASTPDWQWTVLGSHGGRWVEDPWPEICAADVVVTHAGQNALADVAAARRPAIVIPESRPHDEQVTTASVLAGSSRWPAIVRWGFPETGWSALLEEASALDGDLWRTWNDGHGAQAAAAVIQRELSDVATCEVA
ncbi:glycosyl transferase [Agreia pratensis]|uniref:glycosyltransferase n=1 Tax=Agreia pratensis TaxID=150121 RepID=UPI00188A0147|nr:glycosyltransferase [Agreia pratensis]MBF4635516.1 glycosyl transferase [Agreia pratensis]